MRHIMLLISCMSTGCMQQHTSEQTHTPAPASQTLPDFFYPAPAGAEYHPHWHRAPKHWPPHEHLHNTDTPAGFDPFRLN